MKTNKKTIYFIAGFGETGKEKNYKLLAKKLTKKGYKFKNVEINWRKPLSHQTFKVKRNDIVVGFSYGAILAGLIAQNQVSEKAILCSPSPIEDFTLQELYEDNKEYMGDSHAAEQAVDIKNIKINFNKLKTPHIILSGEGEELNADILVPDTGHEFSLNYVNAVVKIL